MEYAQRCLNIAWSCLGNSVASENGTSIFTTKWQMQQRFLIVKAVSITVGANKTNSPHFDWGHPHQLYPAPG